MPKREIIQGDGIPLTLQLQDFAKEYGGRFDEDLLRLAMASDDLTDEARLALTAELNRRGLSDQRLREFEKEDRAHKLQLERQTGKLFFIHFYGIGRCRFCKSEYIYDPKSHVEEFTTTVFVVLFWIPLAPTGTFRVRRVKHLLLGSEMEVLNRLPLNWGQIAVVWALTIFTLLAILTALEIIFQHLG